MLILKIFLILTCMFGLMPGADEAAAGSRVGLAFSNNIRDLGEIVQGQRVSADYEFVNKGSRPVTVQGVHSPCGCTVAEAGSTRIYQPGEKGVIQVTFDSSDFVGRVVKAVTVMTDQKSVPTKTLTLKANVVAELEVNPPVVDFGNVRGGGEAVREIVVRRLGSAETKILNIVKKHDWLDVQGGMIREGEWRYQVKLTPPRSTHFLKDDLILQTDSEHLPEIKVLVRANISGAVLASPQYIEFGAIPPKQLSEKAIHLDGIREFAVDDVKVELSVNGGAMQSAGSLVEVIKEDAKNKKQLVSLRLRNEGELGGSVHGRISVHTDDPEQKKVSIDFYAFFL